VFSKGRGWSRSGLEDVRSRDLSVDKAVEDPGTRERLCSYSELLLLVPFL